MKLSINIMTLRGDEDGFLGQALASVEPYADEIIIRHTDGIQGLGEVWTNSPLDIRLTEILNEMKEESRGEWILKIDDDEIFPRELMEEIMEVVENEYSPIYALPFLHIGTSAKKRYIKRLFRNIEDVSWDGVYGKETLAFRGRRISSRQCPKLSVPFYHLGGLRKPGGRKHDYSTLQ